MTLGLKLEAAFGGSWYDDPAALTWTDITAFGEWVTDPQVSWSRGRAPSMDRTPQPGSFSILLNGLEGEWIPENPASPFYPDVQPGLPVRLSMQDDLGVWVPCFYGFTTELEPDVRPGDGANWTQVTLSAVDGWARVMQAGKRLTYRDRVLTDLAGGRTLAWITGQDVEVRKTVGVSTGGLGDTDHQQWGLVWAEPGSGWGTPGVGGVLAESGAGDADLLVRGGTTGSASWETWSGFESDRMGGALQGSSSGARLLLSVANQRAALSKTGETALSNWSRQQVSAGVPPAQLLPAGACDPVDVSYVTAQSPTTVTREAASGWGWLAQVEDFDPASGSRTTRDVGPAGGYEWVTSSGNVSLTFAPVAVTAGLGYAGHLCVGNVNTGASTSGTLYIDWLAGGGSVISSASTLVRAGTGRPIVVSVGGKAPVGAVQARLRLACSSGARTWQVHAPGLYEAPRGTTQDGVDVYPSPARWWGPGETGARVWLQWPLVDPGVIGVTDARVLWLHAEVPVDWAGGEAHSVAWNVNPGVEGQPVVWVDGTRAVASWWLSYPGADQSWVLQTTAALRGYSAGTGFARDGRYTPNTLYQSSQPLTVATPLTVTGAYRWRQAPTDALAYRWMRPYGAPTSVGLATVSGTTDVLMGYLLDSLGWPAAQRDMHAGVVSSSTAWTDGADLGDYSQAIGELAALEYGWAGVGPDGALVWLPMRWYDPDGDGTTQAKAHLTYKAGVAGQVTYQVGLGQSMSEDKVVNQVQVSGVGSSTPALVEDYDSQQRLGVRREELTGGWTDQGQIDAVASEVLALYGRPVLVPEKVSVQAVGPDDPNLSVLLGLNPADVVLVTIPRAPAADLTVSALVGQIAVTSDGRMLTAELTLGPCPVTATDPVPSGRLVALDTDGVPYFDPATDGDPAVSADTDGVFYYDPAGDLSLLLDTDSTPYVEVP